MSDFEVIRRFILHVQDHVGMAQSAAARTALERIERAAVAARKEIRAVRQAVTRKPYRGGGCG